MNSILGSQKRPLRVAVIGSGPSGFYAVGSLFKSSLNVEVDMFDRLPSPFGLVRYGVAPDHFKIKNVIKVYEKTALDTRFAFFGNVSIGLDFTVRDLQKYYDAIIFACGAETDKKLGIPNEDFLGSHTATEFVGWYNGHPDYQNRVFNLSHPVAVIVGLGNVAMDVARILAKSVDELKTTDITQHALDVLAQSKIKEIHIIGRRGPVQSAFTSAEIKEFDELKNARTIVNSTDLKLNEASQTELNNHQYPIRRKIFEVLQKFAIPQNISTERKIIFHFLKSLVGIKGTEQRVEKLILEKNVLYGEPEKQNAKGTGLKEEIACGNIFRSVGYRGIPIDGVPFDHEKGVFSNIAGRVWSQGKPVPKFYTCGWIKRGSTGIIGTNKADSEETIHNLLLDVAKLEPCPSPHRSSVVDFLNKKKVRFINYADWQKINAAEVERGQSLGKPREKFLSTAEMLSCL